MRVLPPGDTAPLPLVARVSATTRTERRRVGPTGIGIELAGTRPAGPGLRLWNLAEVLVGLLVGDRLQFAGPLEEVSCALDDREALLAGQLCAPSR